MKVSFSIRPPFLWCGRTCHAIQLCGACESCRLPTHLSSDSGQNPVYKPRPPHLFMLFCSAGMSAKIGTSFSQLSAFFASEIENNCQHLAKTVGGLDYFEHSTDNVSLTH